VLTTQTGGIGHALAPVHGDPDLVLTRLDLESRDEVAAAVALKDADDLSVDLDLGSETSLSSLDTAIGSINTARGDLGATQNRMTSALSSIPRAHE